MPDQELPHISPSQLDQYDKCQQQWYFRRTLGPMPPGIALIKGVATHKAAEHNYRAKLESGEDLPVDVLKDVAATEFSGRLMAEGVTLHPEEQAKGKDVVIGQAKDSAVRLTEVYRYEVAPEVQPAIVEETVRIEIPRSNIALVGRIDVATTDGTIAELKTSGKRWNQDAADNLLQLSWYGMAYRHKTGNEPSGYRIDVLVDLVKGPIRQPLTTTRTTRDLEVLLARINAMTAAMKTGVLTPAPMGAWWCSTKWCGFAHICPFYNADRKAAAEANDA